MTREQFAVALTHAAFTAGLALFSFGAAAGDQVRDVGVGLAFGVLPFVIAAQVRRHHRITEETANTLRREGYRLALEHAARGLHSPPPITDDGQGAPAQPSATVHRLHVVPAQSRAVTRKVGRQ